MKKQMAILIGIEVFLLASCAASGPKLAISAEDILGTWKSTTSSMEIQFNEGGTLGAGIPDVISPPGEFRFEGTRLFFLGIGIYEVELLENGNLKFTVIEDESPPRANYLAGGLIEAQWEPVP